MLLCIFMGYASDISIQTHCMMHNEKIRSIGVSIIQKHIIP